ncbi:MAG TPA: hypothetical protein DEH78_14785 [Solibacterales bacterium]|nr:hypothetical protein [Bryobacterales bacterium]
MELVLDRNPTVNECTIGGLFVDGVFECFTLEDAIRETKIAGRTAIPPGRYRITLENSPRFGPDTITINGVPGFTGVRMHAGNDIDDTEGCPLVGAQVVGQRIVGGTSRPALHALKTKVIGAIRSRGESCWITVNNPD